MDDVIFEEFKGTGNMELHLDRKIAEETRLPRHQHQPLRHRREEYLTKPDELQKMWILRKLLHPHDELGRDGIHARQTQGTKTNADFFDSMKRAVNQGTGNREQEQGTGNREQGTGMVLRFTARIHNRILGVARAIPVPVICPLFL